MLRRSNETGLRNFSGPLDDSGNRLESGHTIPLAAGVMLNGSLPANSTKVDPTTEFWE